MLRQHPERKTYSADIKHRTFGRIHLALKTKVKSVAMTRHTALQQLLDTGEPVRDVVQALRAEKITIEAVTECVRAQRPFDTLRASTWPTLQEAVDLMTDAQFAKEGGAENTAKSSETALKHAVEYFGESCPIESITVEQVSAFKEHLRSKDLHSNTIKLYMIKFGSLYTFLQKRETKRAQQQRRMPSVLFSPLDREDHLPADVKTRKRFLSEGEAERLLLAAPADFKLAIALGLFAGLRVGEVTMLRAGVDIDTETGTVFVQAREGWKPKYGKDRAVPISTALEPYVHAHLKRHGTGGGYLFPGRAEGSATGRSNMFLTFRRVVDDAELVRNRKDPEAVSFHTLRHTFASWLVMAGADLFTIARLMGHTTTAQIEETYGHLSPGHRLATVEMLSAKWANRPTSTKADRAASDRDTTGDTQDA